jgi:transcriptional regulator with XRE-family HTH domain
VETLSVALGQTIKKYRDEAKLSQEALANRAGIHRTYMGFVERGSKKATVEVLARIASALGMTAWEILREAEETRPEK